MTLQLSCPSINSLIVSLAVRPHSVLPPAGIIPDIDVRVDIAGPLRQSMSGCGLRLDSGLLIGVPMSMRRSC